MPWADVFDAQARGIEETADLMDRTWFRALAAIAAAEALFRDRLRRRLLVIPLTEDGHFDTTARRAVRRFRAEGEPAMRVFRDDVSRALFGIRAGVVPAVDVQPRGGGFVFEAMKDVRRIADRSYRRARALVKRDRARALVPAGPPDDRDEPPDAPEDRRGPSIPDAPTQTPSPAAPAAPAVVSSESPAEDAIEDAADAVTDLLMNVWHNSGNEIRMAFEQLLGLVTRFGTRLRALDHLDAPRPGVSGSRGWQANRNKMRRSVVEHLRAHHRRRTIAEALRDGATHFRLDVPRARFGRVAPGGELGKRLWKIKTLSDWEEEQARVNNLGNRSADFAGLGFNFGDMSFVTFVPREYLRDAERQGAAWRRTHLGGES